MAKEQTISKDTLTNSKEYTIELGEKLFKKLVLDNDTTDGIGRPTHTGEARHLQTSVSMPTRLP